MNVKIVNGLAVRMTYRAYFMHEMPAKMTYEQAAEHFIFAYTGKARNQQTPQDRKIAIRAIREIGEFFKDVWA